jgi:transposase
MTGTDLTKLDGIDVMTAATILTEAGWDMTKWKDEDHFVSCLRSPDNRISGDSIIGKGRLPTTNRVTVALKLAARNLRTSQSYFGAQFRVVIKAMAAKLARLVYRILRYGTKFVDHGAQFYSCNNVLETSDVSSRELPGSDSNSSKLRLQPPKG